MRPILTITFENLRRPLKNRKYDMIISSLDECETLDISEGAYIDIISLADIVNSENVIYDVYIVRNSKKLNMVRSRSENERIGCALLNLGNEDKILLIDDDREINIVDNLNKLN